MSLDHTPLDYSIAIPAWGRGDHLQETVRSALAQQFPAGLRWEVLVNDDASEPPLGKYLQEFTGQIRYLRNERNLGFAGNFRRTVQQARGRWVHVLHCDDLVVPEYVNRVWQAIQSGRDLGFIHALTGPVRPGSWLLSLVGRLVLGPKTNCDQAKPMEFFAAGLEGARRVLRQGVRITTLVVRRDLVLEMDGYREEFDGVADEEYVVRLALRANSAFIPAPMVRYRQHTDQLSRKIWLSPDFVDVYWRAHLTNLEHLGDAVTEADQEAVRRRVAGGAIASALAHLFAGKVKEARNLLERAKRLFPPIEEDRTCRLLKLFLRRPMLFWAYRMGKKVGLI